MGRKSAITVVLMMVMASLLLMGSTAPGIQAPTASGEAVLIPGDWGVVDLQNSRFSSQVLMDDDEDEHEDSDEDDELEASGVVASVSGDALVLEGGSTFVINGKTEFEVEVSIGDEVEVDYAELNGDLIALEVDLLDADDEDDGEIEDEDEDSDEKDELEASGVVASLSNNAIELEDGSTFVINTDTEFEVEVSIGDEVEVDYAEFNGNLIALEVDFLDEDEDEDEESDEDDDISGFTFGGTVAFISPTTVWLSSGIGFMIDENTEIVGDPQIGDHAQVTFQISLGRLLTKKIVVVESPE